MEKVSLGQRIKKIRRGQNMRLNQLDALTGINYSYLSKIESGKIKEPSLRLVKKIAEALRADIEIFYSKNFTTLHDETIQRSIVMQDLIPLGERLQKLSEKSPEKFNTVIGLIKTVLASRTKQGECPEHEEKRNTSRSME